MPLFWEREEEGNNKYGLEAMDFFFFLSREYNRECCSFTEENVGNVPTFQIFVLKYLFPGL